MSIPLLDFTFSRNRRDRSLPLSALQRSLPLFSSRFGSLVLRPLSFRGTAGQAPGSSDSSTYNRPSDFLLFFPFAPGSIRVDPTGPRRDFRKGPLFPLPSKRAQQRFLWPPPCPSFQPVHVSVTRLFFKLAVHGLPFPPIYFFDRACSGTGQADFCR